MATMEPTLETLQDSSADRSPSVTGDSSPSGSVSSRRLNARAAEFVPRSTQLHASSPAPIQHGHAPSSRPVMHAFQQAPLSPTYFTPGPSSFEYYGASSSGGSGDHEGGQTSADPELVPLERDGLSEEVIRKITKQVEYYLSDVNLATTEHLMRFISKDLDGFVPISVIAAFKKIKALVHNNSQLAMALRTSSRLVVSDDGKKVKRQQPFTESDMEALQSRIVVAENLPEDHCYQNLLKIFSSVGSVKTIRTCYPQPANGIASSNNRPTRLEVLFGSRLHAFVEYETVEDAEKAVAELNEEKNWRSGLRVKFFPKFSTKHGLARGRKGSEGGFNGDEVSTSNQSNERQIDDAYQLSEALHEHVNEESNDKDGALRRGRGWGRGGAGLGHGQHHNNSRVTASLVGTLPSSPLIHSDREQPVPNKPPPGPRMPDGTRGFTIGRGKSVILASTV
ncbi:la-related protein 6B-like isoform X2 [Curcuma longa]|uniref:la-related protein 6B-like isoform X2 n=1 Tax=Curcuma longa TaxID=136217 RepID=UPI003D9EF3BF